MCIKSDKVELYNNNKIKFTGNVTIKQSDIILSANEINIYKQSKDKKINLLTANGNVHYNNGKIALQGNQVISNINNKNLDIYHGTYQFLKQQGYGNAHFIMQRNNHRYIILKKGNFSFCIPKKKHWSIQGSELIYDDKKEIIDIWHAYFNIGNIPVLFIPYLTFSINNKNKSRFLSPKIQYSNQCGFGFNLPYILNINAYSNVTISPNYDNKQGMQLYTKLNYDGPFGTNVIKFNILHKNNFYYKQHQKIFTHAINYWHLYWKCRGIINNQCHFNSDYTKTSNYHMHISNKYMNTNNNYNTQKLWINYDNHNLHAALSIKKFDIHNKNSNNNIYQALPQLDINICQFDYRLTKIQISNQITHFVNTNHIYPETIRLHIEPLIKIPINNCFGRINTEYKLQITHYQQSKIDHYNTNKQNTNKLKPTITRVIPQFKIEGKTKLIKNNKNKHHYYQILEPHIQYLYIPYYNQKHIGIYDSSIMSPIDCIELFRDSCYNGPDRIPSANQLTNTITMHIYNKNKEKEILKTSGGQIYCFSKSRTGDANNFLDKYGKTGSMIWIINSHWYINNKYNIIHNIQYNSNFNYITANESILEYKKNNNHILQLIWNYTNMQYLKKILLNNKIPTHQQNNNQIKIIGTWPLKRNLSLNSKYIYAIRQNHPVTYLTSIKYTTHCWTADINYERKINTYINKNNTIKNNTYDNKISFNFTLHNAKNNNKNTI
ncbi:LPS assembly protein LptD [Blochmannia endosymbiont of Camponotus (Colobopsis) obliquus]|uniref:LPS assembly protein LptD n=1 Tax=Blochmannia endosymbiont of Camponotus (Colobopsis) obliquus TaxID=1505597 RepID=UPI00130E69EC|nr:LPS assembly protein LptD [Blochmannia endosymbiont of Camponotus (Colobopsis) obliquus]